MRRTVLLVTVVALVVAAMLASPLSAAAKKPAPAPAPPPAPAPAPAPDPTGSLFCGATVGGCTELIVDDWFCTEYPEEPDCMNRGV
jgi:hypothetical protein